VNPVPDARLHASRNQATYRALSDVPKSAPSLIDNLSVRNSTEFGLEDYKLCFGPLLFPITKFQLIDVRAEVFNQLCEFMVLNRNAGSLAEIAGILRYVPDLRMKMGCVMDRRCFPLFV
jgi:hypothetical protein